MVLFLGCAVLIYDVILFSRVPRAPREPPSPKPALSLILPLPLSAPGFSVLTPDFVQSLSPDSASSAAGRKLSGPRDWKGLGSSARALWGECQGSALYQTRVDVTDFASKCSCPSRKFPCKHVLGLLFMAAEAPSSFNAVEEPVWVSDWLAQRGAKAASKAEPAERKPVDEKAQAKRADARISAITAGITLTERWLHDLVTQGVASVNLDRQLDTAATRLTDAKAGTLAERLRQIALLTEADQDRRVDELGYVQLLIDLWKKRDQLTPAWRAELDGWIGLAEREDDVLASGARVEGQFFVLGASEAQADRLRERRTWLWDQSATGANVGRSYLLLEFLFGAARGVLVPPGAQLSGTLALYSGRAQQRVVLGETTLQTDAQPRAGQRFAESLLAHAAQLARSPFARRTACCVENVTVCRMTKQFYLRDCTGAALPILAKSASAGVNSALLVYLRAGGAPCTIAFSFDGYCAELLGFSESSAAGQFLRWIAL
jgi:hypothetical protein